MYISEQYIEEGYKEWKDERRKKQIEKLKADIEKYKKWIKEGKEYGAGLDDIEDWEASLEEAKEKLKELLEKE